jgi:hypothetical protein
MRSACTPRREVKRVRQATVCHTCPTSAQTAGPLTSPEAMARRQAFAPSPHPAGGVRGLRVLRSDWDLGRRPWADSGGVLCAGRPQEALA